MATGCYDQLGAGFQPILIVDFAGGTLTTDAGVVLVREVDEQVEPHRGCLSPQIPNEGTCGRATGQRHDHKPTALDITIASLTRMPRTKSARLGAACFRTVTRRF
jgi:hypothetical protein